MLTKQLLQETHDEFARALASGDPAEQRRGAAHIGLAKFALWAHDALVALGADALPEEIATDDPANFASGTDGNPGAAALQVTRPRKRK